MVFLKSHRSHSQTRHLLSIFQILGNVPAGECCRISSVPGHRQRCVTAPIMATWRGMVLVGITWHFPSCCPWLGKSSWARDCSWFGLLPSCVGEWELSQRDIGCALQCSSFNCSLAHFISQHRYSHLACICGLCLSAGTEVTYLRLVGEKRRGNLIWNVDESYVTLSQALPQDWGYVFMKERDSLPMQCQHKAEIGPNMWPFSD